MSLAGGRIRKSTKRKLEGSCTFLTSLVSMQRSMRSTVEMSMYSLHMSFIHLVKLSTVVWQRTHVNFRMLNTRLRMLSEGKSNRFKQMSKLIIIILVNL